MQLPSINKLQEEAKNTFLRFPLAIIVGLIITIIGIILMETGNDFSENTLEKLTKTVLSLLFAFPLFGVATLISERFKWDIDKKLVTNVLIGFLTILYYIFVLSKPLDDWTVTEGLTAVLLTISSYLTCTFGAFINKYENLGFWQFNRLLIHYLALTFIVCATLYAGIALILFTIESLFPINISGELYGDFFVVIAGTLAPLILFSQLPKNINKLNSNKEIPKLAKGFGQYVLTPLVSVYTIILYIYAANILITQEWPKGIISGLIIGYSLAGIITLLILHPFQEQKENKWISKYQNWFYILLIPLTIMLFMAIGIRISDYGFTESRYYVLVLGIWLVALSLYFIISKKRDLKLIPFSVTLVLVLSLFGPWGAFSISQNSQLDRLRTILEKHEIIKNEVFAQKTPESELNYVEINNINSILEYLRRNHDYSKIKDWLKNELPSDFDELSRWNQQQVVSGILGIEPTTYVRELSPERVFHLNGESQFLNVSDYNHLVQFDFINEKESKTKTDQGTYTFSLKENKLKVSKDGNNLIQIDITDIGRKLNENKTDNNYHDTYQVDEKVMTKTDENNKVKVELHISLANMKKDKNSNYNFTNLNGRLLIKFK